MTSGRKIAGVAAMSAVIYEWQVRARLMRWATTDEKVAEPSPRRRSRWTERLVLHWEDVSAESAATLVLYLAFGAADVLSGR